MVVVVVVVAKVIVVVIVVIFDVFNVDVFIISWFFVVQLVVFVVVDVYYIM
jgi:hypothetical protein